MVVNIQSHTDRMMARFAIIILSLGAMYGVYSFGLPVYWRFYATHIKPFKPHSGAGPNDDPLMNALMGNNEGTYTLCCQVFVYASQPLKPSVCFRS